MHRVRRRPRGRFGSPAGALAVAIVAISTSAILVRWSDAPSPVVALYRVLFTTLLLLPAALARHAGDFRRLSRRDLLAALAAGVALAVHFTAWFESLEFTTVAASVTLVQTQALFVPLGAYLLLDERLTGQMVAGAVVALAGAVLMSVGDLALGGAVVVSGGGPPSGGALLASAGDLLVGGPLLGNALAVVGAVMAAGYVLAGRSLRQRVALLPYVIVVYGACTLVLLAATVGGGYSLVAYPPREWLLFLGMAVGPGILGHTLVNWALAHVESSVVSVSLLGEPVGSTILALALLGEVPPAATVLGGGVVLAGIYLTAADRG